jgi:glycosyltransferase involved in cell wall biosynthesis
MAESTSGRTKELCLIGPQPPPRHGVSAMNEAVFGLSRAEGFSVTVLDTAPASLERSLKSRFGRVSRIYAALRGVGRYVKANSSGIVYLSLSGGPGLCWEALLAWRARIGSARLIVHHHSFRYLDSGYWPMNLLVRAVGRECLHVVLCSRMSEMLRRRYPGVRQTLVMSNGALLEPPTEPKSSSARLRVVGFLANLSVAKGMIEVIELAKAAVHECPEVCFRVAGPFEDGQSEVQFREMAQALPNLEYIGPVYGEDKKRFFQGIDAFVFPTKYRNEAEPLVILEAMRHGRPAIAFARGCIESLLKEGAGIAVPTGTDFTTLALPQIVRWQNEPQSFAIACAGALRRYSSLQRAAVDARTTFLRQLNSIRD